MTNNDYLRSIRYILNISDQKMAEIIKLAGVSVPVEDLKAFLKNEEDEGFIKCSDEIMAHFLDGLIYMKRGKDESRPPAPLELPITNNIVLKKLKVAFSLKEDDMFEVLALADFKINRSELSALLRKKDHENYRECGDQFLRNFLRGLTLKFRK
jgi:uncharacterized protein YehS (DUF1456 family)